MPEQTNSTSEYSPVSAPWRDPSPALESWAGIERLFDFAKRHGRAIVAMGILGLLLGLAADLLLPTLYTARATIEIQPDRSGDFRVHPANSAGTEVDAWRMETEVQILRSRDLALATIRMLQLQNGSDLAECPHALPWDLSLSRDRQLLVDRFLQSTTVSKVGRSRLIEIRTKARSAELSSNMANALVAVYLRNAIDNSQADRSPAAAWTASQLAALKDRIESSKRRMEELGNHLETLPDEQGGNTPSIRIEELERNLAEAESNRLIKQARWTALRSAPLTVAGEWAGSDPLLQQYRSNLQQLRSEYASLGETYGNAYPRMAELKAQIDLLQANVAAEEHDLIGRAERELAAARTHEDDLRRALQELQSEMRAHHSAAVQYELARQDYQGNQLLYQGLLQREQENRIVTGFRAGAARVVDPADPPVASTEPKLILNLALGLSLGLIVGMTSALVADIVRFVSPSLLVPAQNGPLKKISTQGVWVRFRKLVS